MKIKIGIYSLFILFLMFESCSSSKNVTYFQSRVNKKGRIVNIPSYRNESTIRFQPDDILGITVNVPGEPGVASEYNLSLIPKANSENSEDNVDMGMGRQTYLIKKDGTIDLPVVGKIAVAGYTQVELEEYLKEVCMRTLLEPPIITVRLLNFDILVTGEVNSPGKIRVDNRDNINILQVLALAGDMTIYGKRDDVILLRQRPDGGYTSISLDISKENIISSPYFFLRQNDALYIKPNNAKTQSADISPRLNVILSVTSFLMSTATFIILLTNK